MRRMAKQITAEMIRLAMAAMGSKGGKRSLDTMTPEERSARAKKASDAAAKKRTEKRLAAEAMGKRGRTGRKAPAGK
jgi:hypothetical protein